MLKLYPDGQDPSIPTAQSKPVVSERYGAATRVLRASRGLPSSCRILSDEFVFSNPSEALRQRLVTGGGSSDRGWRASPNAKWLSDFNVDMHHNSLQQVYQVITAELQNASQRRMEQGMPRGDS